MSEAAPSVSAAPPPIRVARLTLWFTAGLALLVLLPVLSGLSVADILQGIAAVPWKVFVALAVMQALIVLAGAWKWRLVLAALPERPVHLPMALCTTATTLGALAGQVLPIQIVTPAIRGWLARRHAVPMLRSVGGSVYEQMIDFLVLGAAGAASVLLWAFGAGGSLWLAFGGAILVLAGLALAVRPVMNATAALALRLASGALETALRALAKGLQEAARLPGAALRALVALGLLRYALITGLNVGVLMLLVPQANPLFLLMAYPLILLVMSVPVFPGGLGVAELSWTGVLVAAGSTTPEAVEAALVLRIVSTAAFLVAVPPLLGLCHVLTRRPLP